MGRLLNKDTIHGIIINIGDIDESVKKTVYLCNSLWFFGPNHDLIKVIYNKDGRPQQIGLEYCSEDGTKKNTRVYITLNLPNKYYFQEVKIGETDKSLTDILEYASSYEEDYSIEKTNCRTFSCSLIKYLGFDIPNPYSIYRGPLPLLISTGATIFAGINGVNPLGLLLTFTTTTLASYGAIYHWGMDPEIVSDVTKRTLEKMNLIINK